MWLSALDSALCGGCGRSWKLPGSCCPEDCCWDQELQAPGGGSRSFGGFAKILSLLGLQGLRSIGAPAGGCHPQPVERSCGRFKGEFGEMLFKLY